MLSPEEHFRIISETASDAIVTIDEASVILFANPAAGGLFGYPSEELLGKPLTMLMPERMRERHEAGIRRHVETGNRKLDWHLIELPGLHRDGHEMVLEISFGTYVTEGCYYYTGIMRDVSERNQMRRRLDAEQRVMQLLASSRHVRSVIGQVLATLGTKFDWVLGAMWEVDEARNVLHCVQVWNSPQCRAPEFVAATRGAELAFEVGLPGRVWAETKPIWVRDINTEKNFARTESAMHSGLRAAIAFPVQQRGRVLGVMEFFATSPLEPDASVIGLMDNVGTLVGQFLHTQQTLAALHRANRVKSEFLATMSHELRTPLNAMIGYSELLIEGIPQPIAEPAIEKVKRINMSAKHLLGLIEEILTFSRLEAGEEVVRLQDVDAGVLVDEVKHLLEPLAVEKGLTFVVAVPAEPLIISTDKTKLRQMLVNLVGNAIKFTDQGSVSVTLSEESSDVTFDVVDSGRGIESEFLSRIFEPFWQVESGTTREVGGTGLGLSVTKNLAGLLGGDLSVSSEVGKGSVFRLRLPQRPAEKK